VRAIVIVNQRKLTERLKLYRLHTALNVSSGW